AAAPAPERHGEEPPPTEAHRRKWSGPTASWAVQLGGPAPPKGFTAVDTFQFNGDDGVVR
ncbi:MAG TPA: hypothetical protein VGF65_01335, partial [Mycobacterium sp.]